MISFTSTGYIMLRILAEVLKHTICSSRVWFKVLRSTTCYTVRAPMDAVSSSLNLSGHVSIAFIQWHWLWLLGTALTENAGPLPSIQVQDVFEPAISCSCLFGWTVEVHLQVLFDVLSNVFLSWIMDVHFVYSCSPVFYGIFNELITADSFCSSILQTCTLSGCVHSNHLQAVSNLYHIGLYK